MQTTKEQCLLLTEERKDILERRDEILQGTFLSHSEVFDGVQTSLSSRFSQIAAKNKQKYTITH